MNLVPPVLEHTGSPSLRAHSLRVAIRCPIVHAGNPILLESGHMEEADSALALADGPSGLSRPICLRPLGGQTTDYDSPTDSTR